MLHRTSRRNRTRILIAAGLSLSMTLGHSIVASAETPHTVHYNQVVAQAAPINPITIPGLPVQQIDPNSARHIGAGLPNFGQLGPILASFGGAAIFAMLASLFGRNKQSITANRGSQPRVQAPAAAPQPARSTQPAQPAQPRQSGNDATNAGHSRNNSGTSCASDSIVPNYGALATADAQAIVQETNRVRAELGLCPVVWDEDGHAHALPETSLPVELPEVSDYSPRIFDPDDADSSPEPPLGRATEWVNATLDLGDGPKAYRRETNTMPQWAGSCWYELRYIDPDNREAFCDPENEAYWMGPRPAQGNESGGTDLYVGGVEHAVLHLLYARFWHKALFDLGHVSSSEPYHRLFNQGYIQAYAYVDSRGQYVPADEVEETESGGETRYTWRGRAVTREYGKMGKSLKNIVTPDEICREYGADTFRLYEMSMGPLDVSRPWETRAVVGSQRFLQRLWRNVVDEETGETTVVDEPVTGETARLLARTIADVRGEYDAMRINTAIAKMIVLNNHLTSLARVPRRAAEALVLMVSPVAPHVAEELWSRLGHPGSLAREAFPVVEDESLLVDETVTCVVQVRGKLRDRLEVPADVSEEDLVQRALASERIAKFFDGEPRKVIVRAPGLVNIVP